MSAHHGATFSEMPTTLKMLLNEEYLKQVINEQYASLAKEERSAIINYVLDIIANRVFVEYKAY